MIRHIVFDMGRVLINWDPDLIIARLPVTGEDARLLRREVFDEAEWVSMDRGTMTAEEGLARVCRRLPERLHEAARRCIYDWWKGPLDPVRGMQELIWELEDMGYDIYLLSNATSRLHEYFHRIPGSECFSGLIVSADCKLLKPQHEIYEKLFESFSLRPEECFFVDDNPLNVEGAIRTGMQSAVFFNDMARLRRALNAAGVPVKAEP